MRKLVYGIIALLALFTLLRVQAQEEASRFTVHPSLIQLAGDESELSIGFGLVEGEGELTRVWNIFPLRFALRSNGKSFFLSLNGLSFLTRSGVNFGKEVAVKGVSLGDVVSVGGPVTVHGKVEGSVWTFGADVQLLAGSEVTGDVVAVGGEINAHRQSVIRGNKQSLSQIAIPFLGFLTSPQSAETLLFILELFGILLFLLLLFLLVHFRQNSLERQAEVLFSSWRATLLYLLIAIVVLPILVLLLITSVVGIFLIPVLFLIVIILAYFGFLGASVRLGKFVVKIEGAAGGASPVKLYLAGVLGFLILRGPVLFGRLLSLLTSDVFIAIGGFFKIVGSIILYIVLVYGFAAALVNFKSGRSQGS
jgi:hypothetical protein